MSDKKTPPKTPEKKPTYDSLSGIGSLRPTQPSPQPTPPNTNTGKTSK